MLYKTRRRSYGVTTHAQKAANWKLRLIVISIMNIICWWPACILYAIPIATGRSVYNDTFEPKYSEPALILTAAVTVANPVLYVILSKEFSTTVRRFRRRVCLYCSCFDCFDKEREHLRSLTGVNIRVYSSTSELTDTTRLLEDYSVADETNDNEQSN
ncbi:uncharacterized protein LOC134181676 [Corticium candelabrum]|uniref:uncharacterized protein LOC134181676 n=1 Tax=Corticium candelabrum TaxID=121492 RepID=UPI002E2727F1|nr:uncharacterized protein LOC134181676 [Corticium candelabrum]